MNHESSAQRGSALVAVLLLLALLMALLTAYFSLTAIDLSTTRANLSSIRGFYAAEAGLNLRAEDIRQTFLGYNRPAGTAPTPTDPCDGTNLGSGDYRCVGYNLEQRTTSTWIYEPPGNPGYIRVPRGEAYQNLNAHEYAYHVSSLAEDSSGRTEAVLEMHVKSRLVPMFQFAVFYNKDLEMLPGPAMTMAGPVHTNGDLYLDSGASLDIFGQVTTAGDLYRGRKNEDVCAANPVRVLDPTNPTELPDCGGSRLRIDEVDLGPWNGMIRTGLDPVTVPPPDVIDPDPGNIYWDQADLRIVLDVNGALPVVEVRNGDGSIDALATGVLAACGSAQYSNSFFNNREGTAVDMLDVDLESLLDCMHGNVLMDGGKALDDATEGGLVLYLGVDGPDMDGLNSYGARVHNGERIASTSGLAPPVRGLTVVTNQAMYVQGNYNSTDKVPAAFLADSLNILSEGWNDGNSMSALGGRPALATTINAAFLAGTDVTGGWEGPAGQDSGAYNGGVENYPRFHESWSGVTLTYLGSFVSLNEPRHVDGAWVYGGMQYTAPNRNWGFDTDFGDAANLPPLSPRFVYLKQELFMRHFER